MSVLDTPYAKAHGYLFYQGVERAILAGLGVAGLPYVGRAWDAASPGR